MTAHYTLRVTSEAFAEPVSLQEMRDHLRIDGTDQDSLVAGWIAAARQYAEDIVNRQIVTAAMRMTLDEFPCGMVAIDHRDYAAAAKILVPRAPLQSVASITYVDTAGDTQTLDAADYRVDTESEPARITPAYGLTWPATRCQTGAVTVNFVAGHLTPFTAVAGTDTLTAQGRTFTNGDVLRLKNSGGALPTGLTETTAYYVVNASGSTFKLSATEGGSAIDITDAGQGTHFASNPSSGLSEVEGLRSAIKLLVGHWHENREAVGQVGAEIAFAVESLLWQRRVFI